MGFVVSEITSIMTQNVQADCEYLLTIISNTLMSLSSKEQALVEEQAAAGQIYMLQHTDPDGVVDQSAIEYVNSEAFNARWTSLIKRIQVQEQQLELQKSQIETRQKMFATQAEGWEKNTNSDIEKTFKLF